MQRAIVINRTQGVVLAGSAEIADNWWTRGRGLLGRRYLAEGTGLILTPCKGVHSFGMRTAFDAIYVGGGRVLAVVAPFLPNRFGPLLKEAEWVLEVPVGTVARTQTAVGHYIEVIAVEAAG